MKNNPGPTSNSLRSLLYSLENLKNDVLKGRVLLDPGWVSKYENSLNLNLIVPDGL